ncbi:hypothetical protein [Pseudogemmobacter sonorensis]|uniref:hypothetical protein n=1 Tax=Pseudogemmobacter sonorensis TaxID=2989681 RepID=UPI003693F4A2
MRLALLLGVLLATPLRAEIAQVRGGEHPDFTRIVVEAQAPGDWRLGRGEAGYALELGPAVTGFDLTRAFDRIPRDRVSGLWRDPQSGRLRIALSCNCHIIAFEFRPDMIVLDVKDGSAPPGSDFEDVLDAAELPPPLPAPAPSPSGYDWIALWQAGRAVETASAPGQVAGPLLADFGPLREALLMQISRGMAEGVVELAERAEFPMLAALPSDTPGLRIGIEGLPGIAASRPSSPEAEALPPTDICIADDRLALAEWLLPEPVAAHFAALRDGLLGEFDMPDPDRVPDAARRYLALGFGAEARQLLSLLPSEEREKHAHLVAMSHIVDLAAPPGAAFDGMAGCSGQAALWATLALALKDQRAGMDADSVVRAFSALPPHLRVHFGPVLTGYFLKIGDEASARRLRDAALRAPGAASADLALMDAGYQLATGDEAAAAERAEAALSGNAMTGAGALAMRVEAAFRGDRVVPPGTEIQIAAFLTEVRGTSVEAPLRRAQMLALAMIGDFPGAFSIRTDAGGMAQGRFSENGSDLWSLAVTAAPDGIFMAEATGHAADLRVETIRPQIRLAVAERLLALGFAASALDWAGSQPSTGAEEARLLVARARLALRDARGVIAGLAGLDGSEAEGLRARAVLQLGEPATAAVMFGRAGDEAARERALIWAGDWRHVAQAGEAPWDRAAAFALGEVPFLDTDALSAGSGEDFPAALEADPAVAVSPPGPPAGPLARGEVLLAESAALREAILDLLVMTERGGAP